VSLNVPLRRSTIIHARVRVQCVLAMVRLKLNERCNDEQVSRWCGDVCIVHLLWLFNELIDT